MLRKTKKTGNRSKDCHFGAIGQMSGCITTAAGRHHSEVVGGAGNKQQIIETVKKKP